MDVCSLEEFAFSIRRETMLELGQLGFGHIGGAMSVVELLAVLYGDTMKIDPQNPQWSERDYLVFSKGHAGPSLYAALALKGYFSKDLLSTLNQGGTKLPSHADRSLTPGVDVSTGSLGQGVSVGLGLATAFALDKRDNYVYVVIGDGECQEGQIWEAVMYGGNAQLDNLIVFIDYNKQQLDGYVDEINPLGDLRAKWEMFGWHAQDVDGHKISALQDAIAQAKAAQGRSSVIVMHTIKGKGCSFAEGEKLNHHMRFSKEQMDEAIAQLEAERGSSHGLES